MIHSVPVAPKDEEHTGADEDKRTTKEKEQSERINEIAHEKKGFITRATSRGSGKPAHKRSLARTFVVCKHVCLCWGFTAQSTQWGHVDLDQFT